MVRIHQGASVIATVLGESREPFLFCVLKLVLKMRTIPKAVTTLSQCIYQVSKGSRLARKKLFSPERLIKFSLKKTKIDVKGAFLRLNTLVEQDSIEDQGKYNQILRQATCEKRI